MGIPLNEMDVVAQEYGFKNRMKSIIPSTDYATHGIHSYTAKLIPHIPRYFIGKYTTKGDTVLDPFCGSGTTLLEARVMGRNAIGIDINPLAILISEVKTTSISTARLDYAVQLVKQQLQKGVETPVVVEFPNMDYWFCKDAQNGLQIIRTVIERLRGNIDHSIYKFLQLCFSSIIRKCSYADPRIAKIYKSKRMIQKSRNGWVPTPIQYFEEAVIRNSERIKTLSEMITLADGYTKLIQGDARALPVMSEHNDSGKVNFILTSPPYINAQDYFRSYKLELWWLGLATPEEVRYLRQQAIGTETTNRGNNSSLRMDDNHLLNVTCDAISEKSISKSVVVHNYFQNMRLVLEQCQQVLRKDGYLCLITGTNTICGVRVPSYAILTKMAEGIGFRIAEIGTDQIRDRALPPNRNHDAGVIKEEWITVLRKERD